MVPIPSSTGTTGKDFRNLLPAPPLDRPVPQLTIHASGSEGRDTPWTDQLYLTVESAGRGRLLYPVR